MKSLSANPRFRVLIIAAALVLSGASALAFQSIWLRILGLVFGNSVQAAALILSSFMFGLALGNAVAAIGRTWKRPLRGFAGLEILVGVTGLLIIMVLPSIGYIFHDVFRLFEGDGIFNQGLRFLLSFLVLSVPTTAMGLSFPVVLEEKSLWSINYRRTVALFYGMNVLGGVCGVLISETILIEKLGLMGTGLVACLANLTAAGSVLLLRSYWEAEKPRKEETRADGMIPEFSKDHLVILVISFFSGFIFLSLEVVWFRFLKLYFSSSGTVFSIMLATVLSGICLGSLLSSFLSRRNWSLFRILPFLFIGSSVLTVFCYFQFPVPEPSGHPPSYYLNSIPQVVKLATALMFPISVLSGFTLPLIVAQYQKLIRNRMKSAGSVVFFNTVGAAIGPFVATFILLPLVGFEKSLFILSVLYLIVGLVAFYVSTERKGQRFIRFLVLATTSSSIVLIALSWGSDREHFRNARLPYEFDGSELLIKKEGVSETNQLLRKELHNQPYFYRLVTNGFSMSGTHPDSQRYMRLFAWLPSIMKPDSKSALLICHGVGITADAFLSNDRIQQLDIVDISRDVFELSPHYTGPTHSDPLTDHRVNQIVQDGRFFLQTQRRQYDIISGEPPPLKVEGTVNLYTREFFKLIASRLTQGGIATFWLPIYQLTEIEILSVLAAFHHAFPNMSVWAGPDNEWIMMGVNGELNLPGVESIRQWWNRESIRDDLLSIGLELPEQYYAHFLMGKKDVEQMVEGIPPLADYFPKRLGVRFPKQENTLLFSLEAMNPERVHMRFKQSQFADGLDDDSLNRILPYLFELRETQYRIVEEGGNWLAALDYFIVTNNLRGPVLMALNSNEVRVQLAKAASSSGEGSTTEMMRDLIADYVASRDFPSAIATLTDLLAEDGANENDLYLLIYLHCHAGDIQAARKWLTLLDSQGRTDGFRLWFFEYVSNRFGLSF